MGYELYVLMGSKFAGSFFYDMMFDIGKLDYDGALCALDADDKYIDKDIKVYNYFSNAEEGERFGEDNYGRLTRIVPLEVFEKALKEDAKDVSWYMYGLVLEAIKQVKKDSKKYGEEDYKNLFVGLYGH